MADYMASTLGPVFVSLMLSSSLYGCALVQTSVYYKLFPKDSWKIRILVTSEMCLQTVHLAFLIVGVRESAIYVPGQGTSELANTIVIGVVFGGPIAFCTQAFFVLRLYIFSHKKALPVLCSFLVVTQVAFTIVVSVTTVIDERSPLHLWQRWFIISSLFITICADTTIAVSMSYYLKASKPCFGRTSRVVDRMVLYIMGMTTSISSLASGISFLIAPGIYIWLGLFIIESGLYTNSLLAALNTRAKFSHQLQCPTSADGLEVPLSGLIIQGNCASRTESRRGSPGS
ncbi:hypothetical protein EDC04DRAFT_884865 [Pisolithus marmoratus]|nr:hypothetical protein EDC04DRAFT_884865 [Pisolithus marmoratus]